MTRLCACVIVAIGVFSVNEAIAQAPFGAILRGKDAGQTSPNSEKLAAAPKAAAARPPPGGNPLWGSPLARSTPPGNGRFFRRPGGRPCRRSWPSGWPRPRLRPNQPNPSSRSSRSSGPRSAIPKMSRLCSTAPQKLSFVSISAKRLGVDFALGRFAENDRREK